MISALFVSRKSQRPPELSPCEGRWLFEWLKKNSSPEFRIPAQFRSVRTLYDSRSHGPERIRTLYIFTTCEVPLKVHIVTRKHLSEAMEKYPDAADEIKAWMAVVKEVRWHNFPEVRNTFKDADNVKGYAIFDFRRNRYSLVTVVHYAKTTDQKPTQGHVYIRSFLTHKEYDNPRNWDRRFGTK